MAIANVPLPLRTKIEAKLWEAVVSWAIKCIKFFFINILSSCLTYQVITISLPPWFPVILLHLVHICDLWGNHRLFNRWTWSHLSVPKAGI